MLNRLLDVFKSFRYRTKETLLFEPYTEAPGLRGSHLAGAFEENRRVGVSV